MTDEKISELTQATTLNNTDDFVVRRGTANRRIAYSAFLQQLEKAFSPVGSIIGLHPAINTAKAVDSNYWAACDNSGGNLTVTYPDGTTDTIARPDLSDDRFLMGDNVAVATTGGGNTNSHTHNFAHTHGTDAQGGHNHWWYDYRGSSGGAFGIAVAGGMATNYTFDSAGNLLAVASPLADAYTDNEAAHTHTTNSQSTSTTGAPSDTENRPLFFSVKYYMRIK